MTAPLPGGAGEAFDPHTFHEWHLRYCEPCHDFTDRLAAAEHDRDAARKALEGIGDYARQLYGTNNAATGFLAIANTTDRALAAEPGAGEGK